MRISNIAAHHNAIVRPISLAALARSHQRRIHLRTRLIEESDMHQRNREIHAT
jgi:hypothetical protein